jgi:SAM-dependent methyltransferase
LAGLALAAQDITPTGDHRPNVSTPEELRDHYARGEERGRLDTAFGQVEFLRTCEILERALPPAPAAVADVGGGPGRYALWLAERGYAVHHRDVVELHLEQLAGDAVERRLEIESRIADARALDLEDASVDAVLLLGPLYHLPTREERVRALAEARRVVGPGGPVFAAAISRWAPRLHGEVALRLSEEIPGAEQAVPAVEDTGRLPPLFPGSFTGYCHRPGELGEEVVAAGLELVDLVGVEGIAFAVADLDDRRSNPYAWRVVLDSARAIERVPELLGLSPHLLATARRP